MRRFFYVYALTVALLFGYAQYTGWAWSQHNEIRDVPKSIRNNPGVYRTVYTRFPHK